MVKNQSLLDTLKELDNLSQIDVKDPENEEFESGRISTFDESVDEVTTVDKRFGNLRKTVGNDGEVDKKYAGEKGLRRSLLEWSDDGDSDSGDDDDSGDEDDEKSIVEDGCYVETDSADEEIDESDDEMGSGENTSEGKTLRNAKNFDGGLDDDDDVDDVENGYAEDGNDNVCNDIGDDDDDDEDDDDDHEDDDDDDDYDEDADVDILDNTMKIDLNMLPDDLKGGVTQNVPNTNGLDDGVDNFTASAMDDNILKGQSAKLQLDILDKLLESRIRLQKSLHLCNQLPQHDIMSNFREQAGPQIKESYESAKLLMKELLNKLLKLQEVLCETNIETSSILTTGDIPNTDPGDEEIPSDTEGEDDDDDTEKKIGKGNEKESLNLPSKRKHTLTVMDYGEEISKRHKALQPFQDSTINKWHEKTRLASNVINSKNFASFDKSVSQQIKQVLMDKDRLIKRTQLSRVPLNILGEQSNDETKKEDIVNENEDMANEDKVDLHLKDYNVNIFDDGDFYHEMLKELIERKSNINADDPIAAGRRWLELQKLRSKIKRKVDTRASKGRKVRYDVHAKLVSFMVPQNVGSMTNQARNNLFASLFGQKALISNS